MVDGEKPGVDFSDEGKHTGRNDLLLAIFECLSYMFQCTFIYFI